MVMLFLADGFEEIEALTPVDVLRRLNIEVKTCSISKKNVTGAHGIEVCADTSIDDEDLSGIDTFILPGGMPGTTNLAACKKLTDALLSANKQNKTICAICAAPSVLGKLKILEGKKATCFPGFEDRLIGATVTNERVQEDGNIITSRGAGSASDFAFAIAKRFKSLDEVESLKRSMQYE